MDVDGEDGEEEEEGERRSRKKRQEVDRCKCGQKWPKNGHAIPVRFGSFRHATGSRASGGRLRWTLR